MGKDKTKKASADAANVAKDSVSRGAPPSTTVLLVDDDPAVRRVVVEWLTRMSFQVLEAAHVQEALQMAEQHQAPIHLLLTDVVMPGMSGRSVAEQLIVSRPEMKVLYMSGYGSDILRQQGVASGKALLRKPFTEEELNRKVQEALESLP